MLKESPLQKLLLPPLPPSLFFVGRVSPGLLIPLRLSLRLDLDLKEEHT